jgi:hypothetical protein
MNNIRNKVIRDQIVFDDENNPSTSMADIIWPRSVLDAIYDQQDANEITLRQILDDIREEIKEGGIGYITFPVTSVNGMYGDINITSEDIGLGRVNNTSDLEKPLSYNQRNAVMSILENYNFNIDLSSLTAHLANFNNPHNVTIDQLDSDGSVSNTINNIIGIHDTSNTAHSDIRNALSNVQTELNDSIDLLDARMVNLLNDYTTHLTNPFSHGPLFAAKENIANKSVTISHTTNYDDVKYPSSKAVVDFVTSYVDTIVGPDLTDYVEFIDIVNKVSDLPMASPLLQRHIYLIKNKENSNYSAIAACKHDGDNYWWDIQDFTISKYDATYFSETPNGLSINVAALPQATDVYSKAEADGRFIQSIEIGSGSNNGSISYMINGDVSTVVDEIHVTGLQNLAYKAVADSVDIKAGAILAEHIADNNVMYNHLLDGTIIASKIAGNAIRDYHILQGSVKTPAIADRAVTGIKIAAFTITSDELGEGCVNNHKIQMNAVTDYNIADLSILTTKIRDKAVTNIKLADIPAFSIKGNMTSAAAAPTDVSFATIIDSISSRSTVEQLQALASKLAPYSYQHPASHPASIITQNTTNRFVTDAQIAAWNNKSDNGHTHPYLPLTGGTITGNLTVTGTITGSLVQNAVWGDVAELFKKDDMSEDFKPGDIIELNPETGNYRKSTGEYSTLVVGVVSDTYGYLLGLEEGYTTEENLERNIPIGLTGRVSAYITGKVKAGDLITTSSIKGVGKSSVSSIPGSIIGKALENKDTEDIQRVKILILNS